MTAAISGDVRQFSPSSVRPRRKRSPSIVAIEAIASDALEAPRRLKARSHSKPKIQYPDLGNDRTYSDAISFENEKEKMKFAAFWANAPKSYNELAKTCRRYEESATSRAKKALHRLEVRDTGDRKLGKGVFAKQTIKSGTLLGHYAGILRLRHQTDQDSRYAFRFSDCQDWVIDAAEQGNLFSCINHSEEANVAAWEHPGTDLPYVLFFSTQTIQQGEQLFINYGNDYWKKLGVRPIDRE